MDLALGFASPGRRNVKLELPLSAYRSKSFDNSLPVHIPMESDSSSIFETPSSYRFSRWFMNPHYDPSNSNYMPKSGHLGKSGPAFHKITLPKEHSLAISIIPQTIVGGFVGSKTYAGRSMFGDSIQIWDAVVCKFVEWMSLVKEKPPAPKSKSPAMPPEGCISGIDAKKSQSETLKPNVCGPASVPCSSSKKCVPRNFKVSNIIDSTDKVPDISSPSKCMAVVPEPETLTLTSSTEKFPQKVTYSSVVEGTFKNESATCGACTMVNLNQKEQPPDGSQASLPRLPLQSYADVAKIIPNKPVTRTSKSGCEVTQNLKNIWDCRIKKNKFTRDNKVVNRQGNRNKNIAMHDFTLDGDTRWKGDWKSKRARFQRKCPVALPSDIHSSSNSESSEERIMKESFTKESETFPFLEGEKTTDEKEQIRLGCLKEGLRGRHPSECSLDSEDSFVIFEECPDATLDTCPSVPDDRNSSWEESDSEEDDSSSSDSSDSEDDAVDSGKHNLKSTCALSKSCSKEICNWMDKCPAQSVPEKSNGVKKKMVHFAEGPQLVVVRPMVAWGYAYREARRGPWEVHARDRARFHCRIASLAPMLNAVLDPLHRRKVVASRLCQM